MPSDLVIRRAQPPDQAFLREMFYLSLYVPLGAPPFPRSVIERPELAKYIEGWGRPGDLALIAVKDSLGVGAAWLRLLKDDQRGYGYVDDETPELGVALLPESRGQGIGRILLERLLEEARSQYDGVSLAVAKGNPAERLYRRLGFTPVGEDEDSRIMFKRLGGL